MLKKTRGDKRKGMFGNQIKDKNQEAKNHG